MRIYVCSVCGYDYDEKAGDPGNGIAPGTKWEDLPEDWVCPICGADKSMFELQGGGGGAAPEVKQEPAKPAPVSGQSMKKLAVMASNLARGALKQYREEASQALTQLADFYEAQAFPEGDLGSMAALLKQDIAADYAAAFDAARQAKDRGALRALTWGEKVSKIQSGLISRFQKDGEKAFENGSFFVCDACGFIFFGDEAPEICPVCKVPRHKFNRIPKGVSA